MPIEEIVYDHGAYWSTDEAASLLKLIDTGTDFKSRSNWAGHITASALVISRSLEEVLFIQSPKFNKALLPGGHMEPKEMPWETSFRELKEEVGALHVKLHKFTDSFVPLEINSHIIAESKKRNEPEHFHHDFVYLYFMESDCPTKFTISAEIESIGWRSFDNLKEFYPASHHRLKNFLRK